MIKNPLLFGLISDHPQCDLIDGLIGIDFPLDEYNTIYNPALIPTRDFSHKFIFKEIERGFFSARGQLLHS